MNSNSNKEKIILAIWENPDKAFNCRFTRNGRFWSNLRNEEYNENGKIRLALTSSGSNIMVFYNGSSRNESTDVFTYLAQYVLHTGSFRETLQALADLYGVTLEFSQRERQVIERTRLAREVAAYLVEHLRNNPGGETAAYLRNVRGIEPDGHFGELTAESIQAVKDNLHARGIAYDSEDLDALHINTYYADKGYKCVLPYLVNGYVRGFVLRNINPNCADKERYSYSQELGRGGYCDRLEQGKPAVLVEGQFDAIRLAQAGITNVVAVGGAKMGEDIARLLSSHGIREITYIPDLEFDNQKDKITNIIEEQIKAVQGAKVDGEPVAFALRVAELPSPDDFFEADKFRQYKDNVLRKYKYDADSFGKDNGNDALAAVVDNGTSSWAWEIDELNTWATRQQQRGSLSTTDVQRKFNDIYLRIASPYERQRARNEIKDNALFKECGITPRALADADEWKRNEEYANRIKDNSDALSRAVEEGASPDRISKIVTSLNDTQAARTREDWDGQLNATFNDLLLSVKEQPETLKTKWEIGTVHTIKNQSKHYTRQDIIEYFPADIEVFCAATSHGKTMYLFQSALDLLERYPDKTFLYVSCEENTRQLFERALNVYIDVPTTKDGLQQNGEYCFIRKTRKKVIKSVLRMEDAAPEGYTLDHYKSLSRRIKRQISTYETDVFQRLRLIHTDATAENICSNILRSVEDLRDKGLDVGAVFVDYMQLLTSEKRSFSRQDELKDICKALKDCASRTELPIVIAAQLNREAIKGGLDGISVTNIGEASDIEKIAHSIYFMWQIDKTDEDKFLTSDNSGEQFLNPASLKTRSARIYGGNGLNDTKSELKRGYIYIERLKARDGETGGWALLPYDGERGYIGLTDIEKMEQ